jgi:phospholipid/cholesterol/gamma-HCH transport system substrate-binding protein
VKHISQGVKVGILVIVMIVGAYAVWKTIGQRASGGGKTELMAQFRDASGLPEGSRVLIAGLPVGEIDKLKIQGRYALVGMRLRDDLDIYDNAVAMKKSSSLLGDYYIEIDPGSQFSIDPTGKKVENQLLDSGDEITRVVEATSPDQLMRRIEESMPKVDQVLLSVRDLSEDVRSLVNGPIASMANRLDRLVQDESETVERILARLDNSLARVELITKDIRAVTDGADEKVNKILDQIDEATVEAKNLVTSARTEVEQTGAKVREKLDLVDEFLDRSTSIATKIDEDKGTLGRLVNDSTLADNLEDITGDARNFIKTLFGMETWVGLRSEYHYWPSDATDGALFAGNHYITVELRTRPDSFYLIEFSRGFRGAFPDTELVVDPVPNDNGSTDFRRRVTIRDGTRITFQFGKRIGWASFRFGIKESTGGIGFDGQWFDDKLKLSFDVFDSTFNAVPRLKVSAAYSFFEHIYVVAGLDDALNKHEFIETDPLENGIPVAFETFHYGRDAFFGAYLQFNDMDLTALLTIGGGILSAAAD